MSVLASPIVHVICTNASTKFEFHNPSSMLNHCLSYQLQVHSVRKSFVEYNQSMAIGDSHSIGTQKECLTKTLPFFNPLNVF
jgi:hypothetical protein